MRAVENACRSGREGAHLILEGISMLKLLLLGILLRLQSLREGAFVVRIEFGRLCGRGRRFVSARFELLDRVLTARGEARADCSVGSLHG